MTQEVIVIGIGIVVVVAIVLRAIDKIKQIQRPRRYECDHGCTGCTQHLPGREDVIKNHRCTPKKK